MEYSALVGGGRVDYVKSRNYTYVDTYGKRLTLGDVTTDGCIVLRRLSENSIRIIPIGAFTELRFQPRSLCPEMESKPLRLEAYDTMDRLIETNAIRTDRAQEVRMAPNPNAFSWVLSGSQ